LPAGGFCKMIVLSLFDGISCAQLALPTVAVKPLALAMGI